MPVNPLAKPIEEGVPLVVLAPHLDDAALSCGALMIHASRHTSVTVVTFFTEAGQRPYTLSARRYLYQAGGHDAQALYEQRRAEDLAALEPLGIKCVHAGLTEALFRRRPGPSRRKRLAWLIPELAHTYPIYRTHIISGQIVPDDRDTLRVARAVVRQETAQGPCLVLAPLGVGGHVDHVLVRSAAASTGRAVIYYSDFPYNQRNPLQEAFVRRNGLVETKWFEFAEAKARLVEAYRSQMWSLFQDGRIPPVPEMYFSPAAYPASDSVIQMRLWNKVVATRLDLRPSTAVCGRRRSRTTTVLAVLIGAAALAIRLELHSRSFDLYGDEVVYYGLGRSVVAGGFPNFDGQIFFLHGPGFFYLEAAWIHVIGHEPGLLSWIFAIRTLNAALAAATAVVIILLGARMKLPVAGVAAGALFAADPFVIRQNDRVLLETSMMLWVLLGYLIFLPLADHPRMPQSRLRAVGAGLLFGCAVLTKDEAALITILPLAVAAGLRWVPRRPLALLTIGTTAAVYLIYVIVVLADGYFTTLWQTKTYGVQRMLGLVQITGFHSRGGGDLPARLLSEASAFWSTYAVLLVALPMAWIVLRKGSPAMRILVLLYGAAGATIAYAVVFGTLEEQELYLLVLPSLIITPMAVTLLIRRPSSERRSARPSNRPAASHVTALLTLATVLGLNFITCVQWQRQPDEGFVQVYRYVTAHLPAGTKIAAVDGDIDTPYALGGRYQVGTWDTPAALSASAARYLVVEWGSIEQGYSALTVAEGRALIDHSRMIFSARGRTNGLVALYQIPSPGSRRLPHVGGTGRAGSTTLPGE